MRGLFTGCRPIAIVTTCSRSKSSPSGDPVNRVIRVEKDQDYRLKVWFQNGKHGTFDVAPYLDFGVFANLKDPALFNAVRVDYGTLVWPGDLDIAPDTIEAELTGN